MPIAIGRDNYRRLRGLGRLAVREGARQEYPLPPHQKRIVLGIKMVGAKKDDIYREVIVEPGVKIWYNKRDPQHFCIVSERQKVQLRVNLHTMAVLSIREMKPPRGKSYGSVAARD
jgi:hypothetical protein